MWGANAAAPLNSAHFGYGIGAILVNLLVRPFLGKIPSSMNGTSSKEVNGTATSNYLTPTNSIIIFPYLITAALCVVIATGHTFFYTRERRKNLQNQKVRMSSREHKTREII